MSPKGQNGNPKGVSEKQSGQRNPFLYIAGCIDFFHGDMAAGQGENGAEITARIGIRVAPLLYNGEMDPHRWAFNPEMVRMTADADIRRVVEKIDDPF